MMWYRQRVAAYLNNVTRWDQLSILLLGDPLLVVGGLSVASSPVVLRFTIWPDRAVHFSCPL